MRLLLRIGHCAIRKWRITFSFLCEYDNLFSFLKLGSSSLWLKQFNFEAPCYYPNWIITHLEWSPHWLITSFLPRATCVFGVDCLCGGLWPSFVLVLGPLSWALFVVESGRRGVLPFWTAVQTQLAGAWEGWAVGRLLSYRQSAGSPIGSSAPSAQPVPRRCEEADCGLENKDIMDMVMRRDWALRQLYLQWNGNILG